MAQSDAVRAERREAYMERDYDPGSVLAQRLQPIQGSPTRLNTPRTKWAKSTASSTSSWRKSSWWPSKPGMPMTRSLSIPRQLC
jgi:hypothetical protein